jgi:hypothetical protein
MRFPAEARNFLFCKVRKPAAGSGALYPEERWPGLKMTTHFHVVPRSKMGGTVPPSYVRLHGLHRDSFTFSFIKSLGLAMSNAAGLQ